MEHVWFDELVQALKDLTGIADELTLLSGAFNLIGNDVMAVQLMAQATSIIGNVNKIDAVVSSKIRADFDESRQASLNMVGAALSVLKLTKEGK